MDPKTYEKALPASAIRVNKLRKCFKSPLPSPKKNLFSKISNYLSPSYHAINAVNDISFYLKPGERVAFIGPNGAGKSTTLKILTGIMQPTSGQVEVLGKNPALHRKTLAYQIGAVFGQRSQLWFHLPVEETFELLAAIYDIPKALYLSRLKLLTKEFDIEKLLKKPVRQLSLGERMRSELVASLLHNPTVLFLDEPTIGLDITAKTIIRDLLRKQSLQQGVTLLLTSHDTDDIEKVCDRVIIIDQGNIILDDSLQNLKRRYIRKKVLTLALEEEQIHWEKLGTDILEQSPHHLKIEVDLSFHSVEKIVSLLLEQFTVKDMSIEGPPLEAIIQTLYQEKR